MRFDKEQGEYVRLAKADAAFPPRHFSMLADSARNEVLPGPCLAAKAQQRVTAVCNLMGRCSCSSMLRTADCALARVSCLPGSWLHTQRRRRRCAHNMDCGHGCQPYQHCAGLPGGPADKLRMCRPSVRPYTGPCRQSRRSRGRPLCWTWAAAPGCCRWLLHGRGLTRCWPVTCTSPCARWREGWAPACTAGSRGTLMKQAHGVLPDMGLKTGGGAGVSSLAARRAGAGAALGLGLRV